ncbi:hypothetical protein TWF970_001344 [Orbilia oligospora]|uniref:Uncharacterized protein n=1 Tax=Orbilia oligospora TaxID=2813651 RepID=A0A7C8VRF2_ORBOL|nr:hypothetical protein TWF970_001344 [Orbilia oligospora]
MVVLSSLIAALPLSLGAIGSPVDTADSKHALAKRDATEVIYLTAIALPPPSVPYWLGVLAYYPTSALGWSGAEPRNSDEAIGPSGGTSIWRTWPTPCSGNTHYEVFFPSGITFQFDLNFGANNAAVGAVVGGGWNGFNAFTCRRDNERLLYTVATTPVSEVQALINCTRVYM